MKKNLNKWINESFKCKTRQGSNKSNHYEIRWKFERIHICRNQEIIIITYWKKNISSTKFLNKLLSRHSSLLIIHGQLIKYSLKIKEAIRKGILRNFAKFTGKHLCLRPTTLSKKSLWHGCFPVNFTKFPRTPFLQNTSQRLLLKSLWRMDILFSLH